MKLKDLLIIYHFRAEREKKSGYCGTDLENEQYEWCAAKVNLPLDRIKKVVSKWIFEFPNVYLPGARFEGISLLMELLQKKGIKTAVYSDYTPADKLEYLGIKTDLTVASTDMEINCMKPNARGLLYIMNTLKVQQHQCLFIGDRDELDGRCAAHVQMPYLNVKMYNGDAGKFYENLLSSLTAHYN